MIKCHQNGSENNRKTSNPITASKTETALNQRPLPSTTAIGIHYYKKTF
jgi:hypothetical protein